LKIQRRKEVIQMCDFDDFYDDGFEGDFIEDFPEDSRGGMQDESGNECEGWCFGDDTADFAILGGFIGYLEEEIEERKRREREMEAELEDEGEIKEVSEDEIF
jgi:hypothetical protein